MTIDKFRRAYRIRIALFLSCVIFAIGLLGIAYQAFQALVQLDAIERERDQWQRPLDVLQVLDLKSGNTALDLGCGSGYFALKLSRTVGDRGKVLAVDIRRISLLFLWIRAALRSDRNISVTHAEPDDPHLPVGTVDAALIANTYHELTAPKTILDHVFHCLRPGGRLVVVDRGPGSGNGEPRDIETKHHELPMRVAEEEIRQSRFEIVSRQDHFIDRPGEEPWWLIVGRKP
ncbi:MAG TPA: methyltransferase domain-containing protein [Bryobacteraceae bacterium]|jgi:SAM-dependent methyltransferase